MKKIKVSAKENDNKLSYLDNYEEIKKYKKIPSNRKRMSVDNNKEMILSRGVRWFLFVIFIILQLLMNIDHGTLPAATEEIRNDLKIDDNILGIFGSLVFLGNLIGSLFSLSIINCWNRKFILIISLILNALLLWTFTITNIFSFLFINRILVGVFQSFISIYLPVWCDQFGMRNKKTIMISLIQGGAPLGVVSGYFLTMLIKDDLGWTYVFLIQAILIAFTIIILLFVPSIYFSSTLTFRKSSLENEINGLHQDDFSIYHENNIIERKNTIDSNDHTNYENKNNSAKNTLFKNLCTILKHKIYVFSALALASLFFVITAVQYWGSDYMEQVLKIENKHYRLISFSIVCVTSPTLGVILGGWSISYIGGYESKHSISLCFVYALFAGIFSIPTPFMTDLVSFTILLWVVLFFGGAIVPPLTGIIISTLPPHLRGSANSILSFICNLLGYLPAPFVYGILNKYYKDSNDRLAFFVIMYYSTLGVIFLGIACYLRYKHFNILEQNKNLPNKKLLIDNRKLSTNLIPHNESVISAGHNIANIAKVFGSYMNFEENNEFLLKEDIDDANEDKSYKNKINNINTKDIKNEKDDDLEVFRVPDLDIQNSSMKPSPKFFNPHLSIQTPQFNVFKNSNETDFDYLVKVASNENFSKEESIFAPKLYSERSVSRTSELISNFNVEKISKSFRDTTEILDDQYDNFKIERKNSEEHKSA